MPTMKNNTELGRALDVEIDDIAERIYVEAGSILYGMHERFSPDEATTVLLCALGQLAAMSHIPQKAAWKTLISPDYRAGFRFGYEIQASAFLLEAQEAREQTIRAVHCVFPSQYLIDVENRQCHQHATSRRCIEQSSYDG